MILKSNTFNNNEHIPKKYACDGDDISPALSWGDVPSSCASFVLVMDDPDALEIIGKVFDHWILYNIPASLTSLEENIEKVKEVAGRGTHGLTTRGTFGYIGPCPPSNTKVHKYLFTIYALNVVLDYTRDVEKEELLKDIKDNILQTAQLVGYYSRSDD
ncbi:MAG: YbhB/YbcL family Raf kinase inhibitor-like protein [Campylobacterota bacterium]|nr:YbhB/YbcL family Raf kinase inhibitor-like protein [Campylobacterota bacterium]